MPFRRGTATGGDRNSSWTERGLRQSHEKTSTTDGDDWAVRRDGAPSDRTSPGAGARASANAKRTAGAGAPAKAANENRAAEHSKC